MFFIWFTNWEIFSRFLAQIIKLTTEFNELLTFFQILVILVDDKPFIEPFIEFLKFLENLIKFEAIKFFNFWNMQKIFDNKIEFENFFGTNLPIFGGKFETSLNKGELSSLKISLKISDSYPFSEPEISE